MILMGTNWKSTKTLSDDDKVFELIQRRTGVVPDIDHVNAKLIHQYEIGDQSHENRFRFPARFLVIPSEFRICVAVEVSSLDQVFEEYEYQPQQDPEQEQRNAGTCDPRESGMLRGSGSRGVRPRY